MDSKLLKRGQSWIHIFYAIYGDTVLKKLSDFGDDFIKKLLDVTTNSFWVDVLKSWLYVVTSYINKNLQSTYKVTSFPVWYSSKTSVGKKRLFVITWCEKGVKVVHDFLDENGLFLSRELLKNKFNITNVCTMQYHSIKSAIAMFLKKFLFF